MKGPLESVRVVDLSLLLPGPLCSMYLGDMGAEVIKVENPRMPDLTRLMGSRILPKGVDTAGAEEKAAASETQDAQRPGESGMYLALNRNKKAITLNLKRQEGRDVLMRLLEKADILLEGFRPGTLEEMGIGYSQLKEKFPKLIYCAISGYGASGPYINLAGHDGNYISYSGILDITGEKNGPPVLPGFQTADIGGGTLTALSAILAALYCREKTGKGQFLDISMMDGVFPFLVLHAGEMFASGKIPERGAMTLSGELPNYNVYRCKDGKYVMLGALEERFFRNFLRQIGKENLLDGVEMKPESLEKLKSTLTDIFLSRTRKEWEELFSNPDACLSPVNNLREAFDDPQLRERGMVVTIKHPVLGDILTIGAPFKFSDTPCTYRLHPPSHGEHTEEVLQTLGYTAPEISELRKKRAV